MRLEDTVPHYSTNWRAEYQIKHYVAFGELVSATNVLREFNVSCRLVDFDGVLFRHIAERVHPRDTLRDGGTLALARSN